MASEPASSTPVDLQKVISPFKSIVLKKKVEARKSLEQPLSAEMLPNKNLNQEIDELIKRQKATLKEDFEVAKLQDKKDKPTQHNKLKAVVFSSGDTDGAEDEEDSISLENIEEAPVSIIHPSSIRTGLARSSTFTAKNN